MATAGEIGLAAVVGWTLGAPHRGRITFRRAAGYEPVPHRMAPGEPLDAWWAAEWHLIQQRRPGQLWRTYRDHWESLVAESAFANEQWQREPPSIGPWGNPYATGSEAFARAIFWGAVAEDPINAYRWAARDGLCDHDAPGSFLPAVLAAWIASRTLDFDLLRDFEELAQEDDEARSIADMVTAAVTVGGPEKAHATIREQIPGVRAEDARLTYGSVIAAITAGRGDFSRSVLAAVAMGGAASHATAVTAAILASAGRGPSAEWTKPLGHEYVATIALRNLDPPATLNEMAARLDIVELPALGPNTPDDLMDLAPFAHGGCEPGYVWYWRDESGQIREQPPHTLRLGPGRFWARLRPSTVPHRLHLEGASAVAPEWQRGVPADIEVVVAGADAVIAAFDEEGHVIPLMSLPPS